MSVKRITILLLFLVFQFKSFALSAGQGPEVQGLSKEDLEIVLLLDFLDNMELLEDDMDFVETIGDVDSLVSNTGGR